MGEVPLYAIAYRRPEGQIENKASLKSGAASKNLAVNVLCVPSSLDSGGRRSAPEKGSGAVCVYVRATECACVCERETVCERDSGAATYVGWSTLAARRERLLY